MQTSNDLTAFLKDKRITIVAPLSWREIIRGQRDSAGSFKDCQRAIYPDHGAYLAWLAVEVGATVRFITAPVQDAIAENFCHMLMLQGVEMINDAALTPETAWRLSLVDGSLGEEVVRCGAECQTRVWRQPGAARLEDSAAILLFADQHGLHAPLIREAFRHTNCVIIMGLPETTSQSGVAILGLGSQGIGIMDKPDVKEMDASKWPDAARFAAANVLALAAALSALTQAAMPIKTLAQQLSRLQPPALQLAQVAGGSGKQAAGKLLPLDLLKQEISREKAAGKRIVWTNGCFDIVHAGHVTYLERAAALGDVLVVGLNSDASVKKTKGANRPIVTEDQRARLLAALRCVDYLVIYDESSPVELIRQLAPDIYAKGGDYNLDTINQPERRLMESLGGRIELLPGVPGISTSTIIDNILKAYSK